jgi:Neurotransmitter-gated ion-channel ligand binding domain
MTLPFNPVGNTNMSRTTIELNFRIYGINSIDVLNGLASFHASIRQEWNDTSLAWDED